MAIESSLKLLEYIAKVSKESITLNGECIVEEPVNKVILNSSFFIHDQCDMCGRCCINETNAWTFEGLERINTSLQGDFEEWGLDYTDKSELQDRLISKKYIINGKEVNFYISPKDSPKDAFVLGWSDRKPQPRCHWLFEKEGTYRCRIHPIRSVTCGMPHCRFYHNSLSNSSSIGVSQYGRNWALKCPVSLETNRASEYELSERIMWLKRLNDVADDVGVNTYLPDIIEYLDKGNREQKIFEARRKLF